MSHIKSKTLALLNAPLKELSLTVDQNLSFFMFRKAAEGSSIAFDTHGYLYRSMLPLKLRSAPDKNNKLASYILKAT